LPKRLQRGKAPKARKTITSEAQLLAAAKAAARRYREHPNVLGIAAGTKYRDDKPQEKELCVQFFVRRKGGRLLSSHLPRFIFGMRRGRIDRSLKFPTDVIKVGKVDLSCGAGTCLESLGSAATTTILFRNRAERSPSAYYVLTCSHAVGDLSSSPPVDNSINCPDCGKTSPFGRVIKNSTPQGESLDYDIALVRLTDSALEELGSRRLQQLDGSIEGASLVLTKMFDAHDIRPSLEVDCQLARSGPRSGTVRSFAGSFSAVLRGRELLIHNLYVLDVAVVPGDSGGIVYANDSAVGMIVAHSPEGWTWFQSLEEGIDYLTTVDPEFDLRCFD
jgi:hypothetical protein